MEFSYEISEQDYVRGCKLARRSSKGALAKTIIFWLVVIAALMLLFSVVRRSSLSSAARDSQVEIESEPEPAPVNTSTALQNFGLRVAPLAGVALIWAFLMLYWVPSLQRRQYRKDTNVHGVITVGIDSEAFSFRSSAGTSLRSGWDAFSDWREKAGILLLRYPAGTFQCINVSGLSDMERYELRSILKAALAKKK